jgi:hypothetical protein
MSMFSESGLTVTAGGSDGGNVGAEGVLHMLQQEDHLAVALLAVKSADSVLCG